MKFNLTRPQIHHHDETLKEDAAGNAEDVLKIEQILLFRALAATF